MIRITRALLSVHDKDGIASFARTLADLGVELLSTGATARVLREAGLRVVEVAELTRFPELFDGRLKTLTPQIHGGLLMRRDHPRDQAQAAEHGIRPIDLLCVNLYPFAATAARPGATRAECIEMIDIGGPAMIRAAAKNHAAVVVVSHPAQYARVAEALRRGDGSFPEHEAEELAREAFALTASYDAEVFRYLWGPRAAGEPQGAVRAGLPLHWAAGGRRAWELRYGENPGQEAACYAGTGGFWTALRQEQGKELSYNNLADVWAAWRCLAEFDECAAVVVKHGTPSGVAVGDTVRDAFCRARDADALSAFGGVVLFNRGVDGQTAAELGAMFLEVVGAPHWEDAARGALRPKKSLRILTLPDRAAVAGGLGLPVFKSLGEAVLVQDPLPAAGSSATWKRVAGPPPSPEVLRELEFAWRVVRHVRSNAIVLSRGLQTLGLGAGQTSRIDALDVALMKAARCHHDVTAGVLASDAFFPFRDVVDRAAASGIVAIVQPGGSRNDEDSVAAAVEHGVTMYFTGERVFAH